MKVDFLYRFSDFLTLTENHHVFLYQEKDGAEILIRAGRFGFRINQNDDPRVYQEAQQWAKSRACLVSESIPEELVFA